MAKPIVLTGIRPTGPLHLGHYVGALRQWLPLQETHECFFLIADVQALTTHADNPSLIEDSVRQVALDFLAVGLNPTLPNVHFVLQSAVPELTELTLYLSMVTPFAWMEGNPTVKAERADLEKKGKSPTTGFMYYVVSQAADILFVSPEPSSATGPIYVPVGEDQAPHLQDTNRIARAFNRAYGRCFVTCEPIIGDIGRLVGTDGNAKMSKSMHNVVNLGDNPAAIKAAVMGMFTDPKRIHKDDPGTVSGNPLFIYLDTFAPGDAHVQVLKNRYTLGTVGDVEVKNYLNEVLQEFLAPIRERRIDAARNADIRATLDDGTLAARKVADETMRRTRELMHLNYAHLNR